MVFYIFTLIAFIAELIIATAILIHLLNVNKLFKECNLFIKELNPNISELLKTITKISEQMTEFAPLFVKKIKSIFFNIIVGHMKSALSTLIFWLVKTEVEKRITK